MAHKQLECNALRFVSLQLASAQFAETVQAACHARLVSLVLEANPGEHELEADWR